MKKLLPALLLAFVLLPLIGTGFPASASTCGTFPRNAVSSCCEYDPANPSACEENPTGTKPQFPCTMLKDLAQAIRGGQTRWKWSDRLDHDFSSWTPGRLGSANLPVIAAAIALYQPHPEFDAIAWWREFLNCQTGVSCPDDSTRPYRNTLRYMKGHEIMSPLYDAATVTAVVAAHYWGATRNNATIRDGASKYLKQTSALYTLAAAPKPARTYTTDKFTLTSSCVRDQHGAVIAPATYSSTVQTTNCQVAANGTLKHNGPFIAISGARGGFADVPCYFDGNTYLVRATEWPSVTRTMESQEQYDVLEYLQCRWDDARYGVNLYGNDLARRQFLRNHILGTPYGTSTLVQIISPAKFIREYRFLTWAGGQRMTLLMDNPNRNTTPLYGTFFDPSTQNARMLYPWPAGNRKEVRSGYARLLPSTTSPTVAEARNFDPNDPSDTVSCDHGDTTVSMTLPAGSPLFQVVLDESGARSE